MSARDGAARADRGREGGPDRHAPVFVISVAAEMADMHPQTLRQYDRLGLVVPARQDGRHRRYSLADVERLVRAWQGDGAASSRQSSPHGYARSSSPCAAYCHSHSRGRRLPAQAA